MFIKQAVMDAFPEDITEDSIKLPQRFQNRRYANGRLKENHRKSASRSITSAQTKQFVWGF